MEKIKLLIADDHEMILEGIEAMLASELEQIEILDKVGNGKQLLDSIEKFEEIDLVILDIKMPVLDGIETTKILNEKYPEIKVLILTTYNKSEFIKNLLEIGADGYILKNSGKKILLEAIHALASGQSYLSGEVSNIIVQNFRKRSNYEIPLVELSPREKEVVRLIANEKSTKEIAEALFLTTHTVDSHRKSILSKLEVKNIAGITKYAIQTGIIKGFDVE